MRFLFAELKLLGSTYFKCSHCINFNFSIYGERKPTRAQSPSSPDKPQKSIAKEGMKEYSIDTFIPIL